MRSPTLRLLEPGTWWEITAARPAPGAGRGRPFHHSVPSLHELMLILKRNQSVKNESIGCECSISVSHAVKPRSQAVGTERRKLASALQRLLPEKEPQPRLNFLAQGSVAESLQGSPRGKGGGGRGRGWGQEDVTGETGGGQLRGGFSLGFAFPGTIFAEWNVYGSLCSVSAA